MRRFMTAALAAFALAAFTAPPSPAQGESAGRKGETLFERIDRAVKAKEPRWKLLTKNERKGAEQRYFTHEWGRGDEYVQTTTYEYADAEEAARDLTEFLRTPGSAPTRVEKVPGLGDEAYAIGGPPYGRRGGGTVVARRGHVVIRLDTSSLLMAQRFARHMLAEVDAP